MLKIGEFSKLSHLTVKALRFYEKEGLLIPDETDAFTGYRYYSTIQLSTAAKIKSWRNLGLSIEEIRYLFKGGDEITLLKQKAQELNNLKNDIDVRLSVINHILEESSMSYQVTIKEIPSAIVYYAETRLQNYSEMMQFIPMTGAECLKLNPDLKCAEPAYEFCEYPDNEFRETDILIRHNEAVSSFGKESDLIKFREIPAVKVLSIYHKGSYDSIGSAYAYIMKYAEENGYTPDGLSREVYIDGIWNKESENDWLTEIQLPIK